MLELLAEDEFDSYWADGIEMEDKEGNPVWVPVEELPGTPLKLIPSCAGLGGGRFVPTTMQIKITQRLRSV